MNQDELIKKFLCGERRGKASALSISGDVLYSYATAIAQHIDGRVVVNATRYSPTTSRHQSKLFREIPYPVIVKNVPRGESDLRPYLRG